MTEENVRLKEEINLPMLKLICAFLTLFSSFSHANSDIATAPMNAPTAIQAYDSHYIPTITAIVKQESFVSFELSDGSKWKSLSPGELSPRWVVGYRVIVRWDDTAKQYFLHNVTQDPLLTRRDKETTEFVSMMEAPSLKITQVDEKMHTVTLLDGSVFQWMPFIGKLEVGNRAFFSLNEGENQSEFPYFLIGLEKIIDSKSNQENWQPKGEVRARSQSIQYICR